MSFAASDFQRYHPESVTNMPGNGGRMSRTPVSGAKHGLFPRVTKSQRTAGDVIYRKLFLANTHPDNEVAAGVLAYLEVPSRGGTTSCSRAEPCAMSRRTSSSPSRIGSA